MLRLFASCLSLPCHAFPNQPAAPSLMSWALLYRGEHWRRGKTAVSAYGERKSEGGRVALAMGIIAPDGYRTR
jgi:hypothetical protein